MVFIIVTQNLQGLFAVVGRIPDNDLEIESVVALDLDRPCEGFGNGNLNRNRRRVDSIREVEEGLSRCFDRELQRRRRLALIANVIFLRSRDGHLAQAEDLELIYSQFLDRPVDWRAVACRCVDLEGIIDTCEGKDNLPLGRITRDGQQILLRLLGGERWVRRDSGDVVQHRRSWGRDIEGDGEADSTDRLILHIAGCVDRAEVDRERSVSQADQLGIRKRLANAGVRIHRIKQGECLLCTTSTQNTPALSKRAFLANELQFQAIPEGLGIVERP